MAKEIDKSYLLRRRPLAEDVTEEETAAVSSPIDKIVDLAFNPSRDKIREVTIIDRIQGRMFPQLDMINFMRSYCLEIANYRQSPENYKALFGKSRPVPPEPLDELLYRTAQWQKSVGGRNLEKLTDIALAETETKAGEDEFGIDSADAYKDG